MCSSLGKDLSKEMLQPTQTGTDTHLDTLHIYIYGGSAGQEPACQCRDARDAGSVPGLGRSSGEGNDNPLQYSCLENPMDRGAWQAVVHWVTKELDTTEYAHTHTHTHTHRYRYVL